MFEIRIVAVPQGQAPKEIRKAWVGLILPCLGKFPSHPVEGVLTGEPIDRGQEVYSVSQFEACILLAVSHPAAAAWWAQQGYPKFGKAFTFCKDEVEELDPCDGREVWS